MVNWNSDTDEIVITGNATVVVPQQCYQAIFSLASGTDAYITPDSGTPESGVKLDTNQPRLDIHVAPGTTMYVSAATGAVVNMVRLYQK